MTIERLRTTTLGRRIEDWMLRDSRDPMDGSDDVDTASSWRDSPGLYGEALLDRSFTFATRAITGFPRRHTIRASLDALHAAHAFYKSEGFLADPAAYHREPPPVDEIDSRAATAYAGRRQLGYRHVSFDSEWLPLENEPGHAHWAAQELNHKVHAYVLEHDEPRPWLVCVHGFMMGSATVNFSAFDVERLHDRLGLNLVFPVLPLHGPRASGRVSGLELLTANFLQVTHLFAQACWDVRRLLSWLRSQEGGNVRDAGDASNIGLYGISLGAYVSALVAAHEADLACVIAGIPVVDFRSLANAYEPWVLRWLGDEYQIDWDVVESVMNVTSPLVLAPKVPRERRFIYAGKADHVTKPRQARALWRHWEEPEIHWFGGGHVLGVRNATVGPFVERCLERSGMVTSCRVDTH